MPLGFTQWPAFWFSEERSHGSARTLAHGLALAKRTSAEVDILMCLPGHMSMELWSCDIVMEVQVSKKPCIWAAGPLIHPVPPFAVQESSLSSHVLMRPRDLHWKDIFSTGDTRKESHRLQPSGMRQAEPAAPRCTVARLLKPSPNVKWRHELQFISRCFFL